MSKDSGLWVLWTILYGSPVLDTSIGLDRVLQKSFFFSIEIKFECQLDRIRQLTIGC